jgi:dienelactone hydrolase
VRRAAASATLAALVLAGCGGAGDEAPPAPARALFADDDAPLALVDRGRVDTGGPIAVRDVSYAIPGGRVQAFVVVPRESGRHAALVYVHGQGGDRGEFLPEARALAARGAVALTLTVPSSTPPSTAGLPPLQVLRRVRAAADRDVLAVRRAVDVLRARPDVDPARIGYVGWSAGARTGAIVAGVEPRIRALVLMSGGSTPVTRYAAVAPAGLRAAVTRILGQIDPLRLIRKARPGSLLLQNGRRDEVVPRSALDALRLAAPRGTEVRWYPTGHALSPRAGRDRVEWLARRLALD